MSAGVSEQGPSQSLTLSPEDVLLTYSPTRRQKRTKDSVVEETRPLMANRYFSVDNVELWKPSLLQSFGETCHRALYVNDFHVLLCSRRLVLVDRSGEHLTFPPFDDVLADAYAEKLSQYRTLVVIAVPTGVHVAVVSTCEGQRASVLQTAYCATPSPVARIHHLKKGLFGLCCENCRVESLSIDIRDARSLRPQLDASVLLSQRGWMEGAFGFLSKKRYVHSFFDHYQGYLLLLTGTKLCLWMYHDENNMSMVHAVDVARTGAVAVVAPDVEQDESTPTAMLVTSTGGRIPVDVISGAAGNSLAKAYTLVLREVHKLPSGVTNTAVSLAVSCGSSLVLADHATTSLVLSTQGEAFCEAPRSPVSCVVSQLFLGKRICGVGVDRRRGEGGDFVTFLVYCGDSTVVRIGRVPRGQLLQRQFAVSPTNGVAALTLLDPVTRVDVLLDAALGGLSLQAVSDNLSPLMHPRALAAGAVELSDGAKGVLQHAMRHLGELSRLCSSFQYWRLSEELTQARVRLEKCHRVLTEVLNAGGWLDCPVREDWRWNSDLVVGVHVSSDGGATAVDAQAALLQLLLSSLRNAATIAWLYDMMLQSDHGHRFPGRLEDMLWKGDPSAVQNRFCMDLLAMERRDVTERLRQSGESLPQRCRLAATLRSLVQAEPFESVMSYVREHIGELAQHDLLTYTNDVVEANFPCTQSRLLLLLYYYPHHHGASSEIVAMVEQINDAELLRRALTTILRDAACDADLTGVLLDWMESHSLADARILTFAKVVVEANLNVDPAHTLTGRFFSSYKQEVAGHVQQASFRFGELARSDLSVPLTGRLLAVRHALQAAPSDLDRITEFILLLQQQLANLLEEHLQNGKDLLYTRGAIEGDLTTLREHYLSEARLFELAGKYKPLGGCSIQLDLLKVHPDAAQFTIANAITGVLTFLTAVGLSATEAVRRVLKEHLDSFQAPLPLFPFVEFLAFDKQTPTAVIEELAAAGVQLPVLFDIFMGLLDGHHDPLFPVGETVSAVAQLVPRIDMSVRHICAAHLLECSRNLLEGDQRGVALSDEEEVLVRGVSDEMCKLSQRG